MSFDLDELIDATAASSRSRFPATGDPIDRKVVREFQTQTRDRDAADRIARVKTGPQRYRPQTETPVVVVPGGVRKPVKGTE